MQHAPVAGVDGCPAGWLRIERLPDGTLSSAVLGTAGLFADALAFSAIAIDIPIGFAAHGDREVDRRARQLLGSPRSSSVFSAPPRDVLVATSYLDACERSFVACGKRMSQQAYNILPKMREVDLQLTSNRALIGRVHEVHPEVSFHVMAGGRSMHHSKRTPDGLAERVRLVEGHFGGVFDEIRARYSKSQVNSDDIVDALSALWTAERIQAGCAIALCRPATVDEMGIPMQILA